MYYMKIYESPLGTIHIAADEQFLRGVWFEGQKYFAESMKNEKQAVQIDSPRAADILERTASWLDDYFAGKNPSVSGFPLAPVGSPFRQEIWKLLLEIPYGEVTTYGALAKEAALRMGRRSMSAQAVGGAVGHNPISILIPCHRIIGADGSLTGYAGGLDRKMQLLTLEGREDLTVTIRR